MTTSTDSKPNWELSLYEQHRTPHQIVNDDTAIGVPTRSLHSDLKCPICLDMLTQTMTTKDCLHRFCAECIITALRSGNKECPTCRKKLVSKRSLRPDPNFDELIAKVYSSHDAFEKNAYEQQILATLKKRRCEEQLQSDLIPKQKKAPETITHDPSMSPTRTSCDKIETVTSQNIETVDNEEVPVDLSMHKEVELILKPHPPELEAGNHLERFIKTTDNATVEHLRKYLELRLAFDLQPCHVKKLYICPSPEEVITLMEKQTLREITDCWNVHSPLEIYYSCEN